MINRVKNNKQKINTTPTPGTMYQSLDFSKVRVGTKYLEDATYVQSMFSRTNSKLGEKDKVLNAIDKHNIKELQEISNFFYNTSGIYKRLCKYMAYMYRYDWIVTPYIVSKQTVNKEKVVDGFNKALQCLDNFGVKDMLGSIALKVVRDGCYYGYIAPVPSNNSFTIQELPSNYSRSRFTTGDNRPVVEFNMKYFDDMFKDSEQRSRMLELFPAEFKKGYRLFKQGKLVPEFQGDSNGWYLLDIDHAVKFNLNGNDAPDLISVIPAIIDYAEAQEVDRKKMLQQLLKIIVQRMPIDKNGDVIFDPDEAQQLHLNAVQMLSSAIGVKILTTFADTEVADMASNSANNAADKSMDRAKAAVYDQAGVSQMQFNTDGNLALEKSVANDEASIYNLVQQFEKFLNLLLKPLNKNAKKFYYRVQILGTTIYNYKDLAKLYKEQTQLGYSKMLPQIALGQSQSSVLANARFENEILNLVELFVPPMSSNTMSAGVAGKDGKKKSLPGEDKQAGRPEKPDDEKSTKTIQNKESQS